MDVCPLLQQLQLLEGQFLSAVASGVDACNEFAKHLDSTLTSARHLISAGDGPPDLLAVLPRVCRSFEVIITNMQCLEDQRLQVMSRQSAVVRDIFVRAGFRRRHKRSSRSRKSKAGKSGRPRQSGKKSKRGRKSPVGNPKRRAYAEVEGSATASASAKLGKKSRIVTAPPTDSMKFGACRDFFLSHLGDPYPTTVQKHQILKQSSTDFTLRSLNLWFVNIRRRSKWMDIFKKHAGSKRDSMRDLVARVEAQVAGRPPPNPLPSGAAPPGCKVDQSIVEEVMAMRAVVDMVSREVYGEGWDQILKIRPWTEEEVRAHEERKKAMRREARAAKADGGKRKQDREARREQRKRDREQRKQIEQGAVQGIRAARELHEKLMAMNKRKRDDNDDGSQGSTKRRKDNEPLLDEDGRPKKHKVRVPKFDEGGNPLTREQRKALKKAILAAQAQINPLKRKSSDLEFDPKHHDIVEETNIFPSDISPSKRRRRDAVTFEGFPPAEEANDVPGMADLTQLFAIEWASPSATPASLPPADATPTPVPAPAPAPTSSFSEFVRPSESQNATAPPPVAAGAGAPASAPGEVPRRFSQQLAAYALENSMFDDENFELFTEDTFPSIPVDVNQESGMASLLHPQVQHHPGGASMDVTPVQTEAHTPVQGFVAPIETSTFNTFVSSSHAQSRPPPSPYSSTSTMTPTTGDADSDMSWINAALAQLPSEHDTQHQQFPHATGSQDASGFNASYVGNPNAFAQPTFTASTESRAPVSHQRTPLEYSSPQVHHQPQAQHSMLPPPTPSMPPAQARRSFPHPQSHSSTPTPSSFPHPQPQPQSQSQAQPQLRPRAPGGLWQTPYSQPAHQQHQQQQYHQPPSPFSAPSPAPPRSFPAPVQQQYEPSHERRGAYTHPSASSQHEYQHAPVFPQPQSAQYPAPSTPAPAPAPTSALPTPDAASILKQHELEFARAQEDLRNRFKHEQEEQLARFLRAQEDLRKQLLPDGSRP